MAWPPSFLVIEDDLMYRTLYIRSLQRFFPGARIVKACDGAEAQTRLAEDRFELVVMDLNMPVLDGVQLLAQIKERPQHRDLVVLVISAFDSLARCVRLARYPNVFAFPKPLRVDELQQIAIQCLRLAAQLRMCDGAPSGPPPDIVDRGHISLYVGQDEELQGAITEQFILLAPNLVSRLQRAIWADNFTLVTEFAHDAHAVTTIVGAHHAAKLARRLALCAQDNDRTLCDTLCKHFAEAVVAYSNALSGTPGKKPPPLH